MLAQRSVAIIGRRVGTSAARSISAKRSFSIGFARCEFETINAFENHWIHVFSLTEIDDNSKGASSPSAPTSGSVKSFDRKQILPYRHHRLTIQKSNPRQTFFLQGQRLVPFRPTLTRPLAWSDSKFSERCKVLIFSTCHHWILLD
jgi:hypothetical protein